MNQKGLTVALDAPTDGLGNRISDGAQPEAKVCADDKFSNSRMFSEFRVGALWKASGGGSPLRPTDSFTCGFAWLCLRATLLAQSCQARGN
jgi:hypothetical protein